MHLRGPARAPRRIIALVVAITLAPLMVLAWLGARLLEQDRLREQEQERQRVELAADLAIASLQQALVASVQRLAAGAEDWPAGAVAVTLRPDGVEVHPPQRVAYLPLVPPLVEAPNSVFAEAEAIEYRRGDHATAASLYRQLSQSSNVAVRAGALVRLGRTLEQLGRAEEALALYDRVAGIDGVAVGGFPASLVGRYARGRLLETHGRWKDLRAEAERLAADLHAGRWALTRTLHRLAKRDVTRWTRLAESHGADDGAGTAGEEDLSPPEVLAGIVAHLWARRRTPPADGHETIVAAGQRMTLLWQGPDDARRVLIADPAFAASQWLPATEPITHEHRIELRLGDANDAGDSGAGSSVRRTASAAALPWDVVMIGHSPAGLPTAYAERRRWQIGGFALLSVMALMASGAIIRGVSRELAAARMQSDFVAAVSHEFRTPLTTLRQFTEMLRDQEERAPDDRARRRICYDAQLRATERLTRLVEALLDFGRMEAGARRYECTEQDGAELTTRVVDEFRVHAAAAGYDIRLSADTPAPVSADAEALSRAIWNLLDNAVKYSPDHRTIDVAVRRRGREVCFSVRDHGLGIPSHERSAIFRRFQRGAQAHTRGIGGTGIGLTIVQEIVRAHGGRIGVESESGRGSTFTIVLPLHGGAAHV